MKSGNNQDEEEDYDDEDLTMKKEPPSFSNSTSNSKEGKNNDKANAIRSKHSVTEQRRRSKINERFQILRDLIPNSDQKRDTASFLLEVIEYVQYLQEKVQGYEGSYQGWNQEPTKLLPWRNSHWRVQSFVGHPQAIKNSLGPTKLDDNNNNIITPTMLTNSQFPVESNPTNDAVAACKALDPQPDLASKAVPLPLPLLLPLPMDRNMPASVSDEGPTTNDSLNQQEDHVIEGGTISISSVYSEGLLKSLTQALQTSGLDLSQASISVQIDLGNRANRKLTSGESSAKENENSLYSNQAIAPPGGASSSDSDRAQKRFKT